MHILKPSFDVLLLYIYHNSKKICHFIIVNYLLNKERNNNATPIIEEMAQSFED